MAYTWGTDDRVDRRIDNFAFGLVVVMFLWTVAFAVDRASRYGPDRPALAAAHARLEDCARGYLGARLDRTQSVHWVALPDSAVATRARVALPDTVYLHPAWRASEWTLAHELLHVAVGRAGHPSLPFATCGLLRPEVGE